MLKFAGLKNYNYMNNRYETVFILTPVLSEVQAKEAVKKYKKLITDSKGKVLHEEHWGLKKLAYPIQKKNSGFYQLIEFEADPSFISELDVQFRRDEMVLRDMTIKMDKDHIAFAENRPARSGKKNTPKKEKVKA